MTITARDLAAFLGAELEGDPDRLVSGLGGPEKAGPDDLIYCESMRFRGQAAASRAGTALVLPGIRLEGKTLLQVSQPKLAFARAAALIVERKPIACGVHPSAVIAPSARFGSHVAIGPFVVIEDGVEIGEGSEIGAFCFLGRGSRIGEKCRLFPRVTLYPGALLGDRVILHAGVVIGSDGEGTVSIAISI